MELQEVINTNTASALKQCLDWMFQEAFGPMAEEDPQGRTRMKRVVLGLGYSASIEKIAASIQDNTAAVQAIIDRLRERFPLFENELPGLMRLSQPPHVLTR